MATDDPRERLIAQGKWDYANHCPLGMAPRTNHPMADNTQSDVVELAARAVHEHLCRRNIMQYLGNKEDCEGIARAVLASLSTKDDARSDRDAIVEECARVAEEHIPTLAGSVASVSARATARRIAQAIRDLKGDR